MSASQTVFTLQGKQRVLAEGGCIFPSPRPLCPPRTGSRRLPLRTRSGSTPQLQVENLSHTHSEQVKSDQAEIFLKGVDILAKILRKVATLPRPAAFNPLSGSDK